MGTDPEYSVMLGTDPKRVFKRPATVVGCSAGHLRWRNVLGAKPGRQRARGRDRGRMPRRLRGANGGLEFSRRASPDFGDFSSSISCCVRDLSLTLLDPRRSFFAP